MTNQHGDFIWYELLTSDADAAGDFYGKVVGWTSTSSGQPDMDYRFFSSGDGGDMKDGVGGYMAITPDMAAGGAQSAWVGYIAVEDVDASVTSIQSAGGKVLMPAMDLEAVGRMAMVADPQGAPFYVMRGASDDTSYSFAATEPKVGHCAWNELATSDPEAAKAFYTAQFGWVQEGDMDMGPMGKYQFLQASGGRFALGAVMPKMPEMPMSAWGFYFRVPDIDAASETVKLSGGTILMGPMEIPGGEYSLNAMDPQGAAFGLVGPRT
ncbi:MAG TPA: VOC family protein [Sphingorhabdus sp.]|nr:VOC family protein [Sphingorhabdus sp.]